MTQPDRIVAPRRLRLRTGLGAAVVLGLVGLSLAALVTDLGATGASIFVHLLGAVARPGLYELREGDRAVDAVAAAGGFADQADQTQLNLAGLLADRDRTYVPAAV